MSVVAQRTQILIKDLPFQTKYALSHSQTDLMAYLVNVPYWAINVDGYFVIATNKIMEDMPTMGKKTIEASLKVLKTLDLIECKTVEVTQWSGKPRIRGLKITAKGKEYNAKLALPNQDERVIELQKENKKLKRENQELVKMIENMTLLELEASAPKEKTKQPSTPTLPKKEAIEAFIEEISKRFGRTGKPLCNGVPKWNKKTIFNINSYNKLSLITPEKREVQVKSPTKINEFWNWLFNNSDRVGDVINFAKAPTISELKKYFINKDINLKGKRKKVYDIVKVDGGVKLKLENENQKRSFVIDTTTQKDMIFSYQHCQDILFKMLM